MWEIQHSTISCSKAIRQAILWQTYQQLTNRGVCFGRRALQNKSPFDHLVFLNNYYAVFSFNRNAVRIGASWCLICCTIKKTSLLFQISIDFIIGRPKQIKQLIPDCLFVAWTKKSENIMYLYTNHKIPSWTEGN